MINIVSCVSTPNVHLSVGAFVNGFAVGGVSMGRRRRATGAGTTSCPSTSNYL